MDSELKAQAIDTLTAARRLLDELAALAKVGREFLEKAIAEESKKHAERAARSGTH